MGMLVHCWYKMHWYVALFLCFLHQVLPCSLDMMPRCQHAPVFFVSISLLSSYSFSLSALSLFPSIVSLD